MNPNYNQTITVYNRIKGADTEDGKDIWKRTVLENCFYKLSQTKIDDGKTAKMAGTYIARIPESPNYLPYREFAKTKGAGNSFTLNPGDIVVKDACMEEITGKMPNTASELLARQKPEAFQITAFSDNTSHLRGKHYRVCRRTNRRYSNDRRYCIPPDAIFESTSYRTGYKSHE